MREVNNTLEEIRRRKEERERIVHQTEQLQQARRAQEAAIIAGANDAARDAVVARARPNLIFAGKRIPLPAPPVNDDEEGKVHEVSSDSSFDCALDEMEGELHRNSLSNPDDAPKPELFEESVAQKKKKFGDDGEVAKEDNEVFKPMEEDKGESVEGLEDVAMESGTLSNEGGSDKDEMEKSESKVAKEDEEMEEKVEEDDEERFQREIKRKGK